MAKSKTEKVVKEKKPKNVVLGSKRGLYTLEVSVNDVEYKNSANSMVQALSDFALSPVFPFAVKTRVLFKFSDGTKEGIQRYSPLLANRMFRILTTKPQSVEIVARKMEARMN